jgi:hypothetical protein
MMKVRVFGVEGCELCKRLTRAFDTVGMSYMYVDANAEGNQTLCDANDVDELPHVQILEGRDVLWQAHGYVSPLTVRSAMSKAQQKRS